MPRGPASYIEYAVQLAHSRVQHLELRTQLIAKGFHAQKLPRKDTEGRKGLTQLAASWAYWACSGYPACPPGSFGLRPSVWSGQANCAQFITTNISE
ncbi:hypothetical protein PG994_012464 [Apiospora phragmitis]|uniref:Uncharacterized protein n=1 Tax=Apiospora phragmitis TaxID=2905665 RepID=A0ABR1TYI3_9PEZI